MHEQTLSSRALKTSGALALAIPGLFLASGHAPSAWGFLLGAALSVISLFSLAVLVPFLLRPNGSRFAGFLLLVTLFMKMPLYIVGMYLLTRLPGVAPLAGIFGIALAPMTIAAQALSGMLFAARAAQPGEPQAATANLVAPTAPALPEIEFIAPRAERPAPRTGTVHPAYEGG